jgi:hypothetical protein
MVVLLNYKNLAQSVIESNTLITRRLLSTNCTTKLLPLLKYLPLDLIYVVSLGYTSILEGELIK